MMIFKNPLKRIGFSMMEVLLAVFIVGILAMVTIPIINRQLEKSDEYSYYLAYKTVEKMAGQIVAQGDPAEDTTALKINDDLEKNPTFLAFLKDKFSASGKQLRIFVASIERRFVLSEAYVFSKLFPKTFAKTVQRNTTFIYWPSGDFDEVWLAMRVCSGDNTIVKTKTTETKTKTNEDGTTSTYDEEVITYYTKADFGNCVGYTVASAKTAKYENLSGIFNTNTDFDISNKLPQIGSYLANSAKPNAKDFCENQYNKLFPASQTLNGKSYNLYVVYTADEDDSSDDDEDDEDDEDDVAPIEGAVGRPESEVTGYCELKGSYSFEYNEEDPSQNVSEKPSFASTWCTAHGYVNMQNMSSETVDCQCYPSTYIISANNEKACYAPPAQSNQQVYDYNGHAVYCSTDFNSKNGTCCPTNSVFSGTECQCISGYKMEGGTCVLDYCPKGSHKSADGVCITNPPIVKANRFCELIADNWNLSNSSCNTFTDGANTAVYNAALGMDGGNYLSIKSQAGAFKDLAPNIEFSNGLKMWILGDKAASIPGLSATPTGASSTQNMCQKITLTNNNAAACTNEGGYFCKGTNNCFKMATNKTPTVDDARGCCASVDLTDYITAASKAGEPDKYKQASVAYGVSGFTVFVDINGDKGNGTLWDDVYPFYIAANGTVYPAYPLDGMKTSEATSNSLYLGGNSEKQLPVDVYYYTDSSDSRKKVIAFSSVSYARAACSARKVSQYTPYCLNLGDKFQTKGIGGAELKGVDYLKNDNKTTSKNPCDSYNCFVTVRKKSKLF